MRLIQYLDEQGARRVAADLGEGFRVVRDASTSYDLAQQAMRAGQGLKARVLAHGLGEAIDYDAIVRQRRLLLPFEHPDKHRTTIAITGLTHLGSATSRDAMHKTLAAGSLTDTMAMFKLGLEGGKPAGAEPGVQSEWAYKGNGLWAVAPGQAFDMPAYGDDVGDEAEVVGIYMIGEDGEVWRIGFALGTELTDHVMERKNYLYLAHSKLRQCSYGPELLVDDLPAHIAGRTSVRRAGQVLWEAEFLTGEDNMTHSIANLEYHHFKYAGFREPGDVHVYFYGASEFSFASGHRLQAGDELVVEAAPFGRALVNTLDAPAAEAAPAVKPLY
ncbi:AraD1 family protein [Bordetella genomosp. 12]|uniref:FAH family protein n=1 Tax=Bordetella genomosp. 12 TaxID=463035 RepID=A0A261VUE9_9BORD|nr:AraD1 family protein [Bordetella genomosp. 12]OZI77734.1 hypothetical protein CAL22_04170 [Bordetella genomosp. 12]